MVWWEIYADESGELIVERHAQGWRFEPTGKVGRPRKVEPSVIEHPPRKDRNGPNSVLPNNITIEKWAVV